MEMVIGMLMLEFVILERDVNGMLIKRGYALRRYGWWKGRDSGMDEGYGMVIGA